MHVLAVIEPRAFSEGHMRALAVDVHTVTEGEGLAESKLRLLLDLLRPYSATECFSLVIPSGAMQ